jgi:hypothetical protein
MITAMPFIFRTKQTYSQACCSLGLTPFTMETKILETQSIVLKSSLTYFSHGSRLGM